MALEAMFSFVHMMEHSGFASFKRSHHSTISLKFSTQQSLFTHNGRNEGWRCRGKQQLLEKAVPIIQRFHQSTLLPGTLKTQRETETQTNTLVVRCKSKQRKTDVKGMRKGKKITEVEPSSKT